MTNDLISDMLTRIRNASLAKHSFTKIQFSKINLAILKVLKNEGYIKSYSLEQEENKLSINVILKYKGWWVKKPLFSTLERVSKPGQRVFSPYRNFTKIIDVLKYNQGVGVISTSLGVMSHKKATKLKKGGEILCFVG
jgi:small subunit ribosomal protein S8